MKFKSVLLERVLQFQRGKEIKTSSTFESFHTKSSKDWTVAQLTLIFILILLFIFLYNRSIKTVCYKNNETNLRWSSNSPWMISSGMNDPPDNFDIKRI